MITNMDLIALLSFIAMMIGFMAMIEVEAKIELSRLWTKNDF